MSKQLFLLPVLLVTLMSIKALSAASEQLNNKNLSPALHASNKPNILVQPSWIRDYKFERVKVHKRVLTARPGQISQPIVFFPLAILTRMREMSDGRGRYRPVEQGSSPDNFQSDNRDEVCCAIM